VSSRARLVIPFSSDSREARMQWLGEGAAIAVAAELEGLGAATLSRDDRLAAFERLHVPATASLSHATVIRVGQLVEAAHVVLGRVALAGTDLTVAARTLEIESGLLSAEIVERGRVDDLFAIAGRVALRLVPGSVVPAAAPPRPAFAAFEQYVKGLVALAPSTRTVFLTQALWLSPALHDARFALWDVHTVQGEHQKALEIIRAVPAGHSRAREAQFLAGSSLVSLGRHAEAATLLGDLHRAAPNAALANNLGVIQLRRTAAGAGSRGASWFADATRLNPADADLFFNLGYAHWLEGNAAAAADALREAVRRAPADAEAHYVLGVALTRTNAPEAARERDLARRLSSELDTWAQSQPGAAALPRAMERPSASLVGPAGRVQDVIVAAEQRDQRTLAQHHLDAGRRLFAADRDDEAASEVGRAIYLAPYEPEALVLLGRIRLRGGMIDEAVDVLKVALWCQDSNPARLALAEAYLAGQDAAAARAEVQAVIARDPQNAEAAQLLARLSVAPPR
jgi:tetratricopeptide (TPR) repeat protein/TolB-like protein